MPGVVSVAEGYVRISTYPSATLTAVEGRTFANTHIYLQLFPTTSNYLQQLHVTWNLVKQSGWRAFSHFVHL